MPKRGILASTDHTSVVCSLGKWVIEEYDNTFDVVCKIFVKDIKKSVASTGIALWTVSLCTVIEYPLTTMISRVTEMM